MVVDFLLSLVVMFLAPEIAAKIPAPKVQERPVAVERAAPAPPRPALAAEVPWIAPASPAPHEDGPVH